jgi:hypothetical protein
MIIMGMLWMINCCLSRRHAPGHMAVQVIFGQQWWTPTMQLLPDARCACCFALKVLAVLWSDCNRSWHKKLVRAPQHVSAFLKSKKAEVAAIMQCKQKALHRQGTEGSVAQQAQHEKHDKYFLVEVKPAHTNASDIASVYSTVCHSNTLRMS